MSRIRSVHPGQPTDESFVSCSPFARLLAIFIRNEADDRGIFEWKPLQLKMRIFPADAVDVAALLAELAETGQVARYEVAGKPYGIIRNFLKYQRVRRPSYVHPLPLEGQVPAAFLIVPDNGGNDDALDDDAPDECGKEPAEVGGMRKDVGGKREKKAARKRADEIPPGFDGFWEAYPRKTAKPAALKAYRRAVAKGAKPEEILAGLETYKRTKPDYADWCHPATWLNNERWNDEPSPAAKTLAAAAEAGLIPQRPDAEYKLRKFLQAYKPGGFWPREILNTHPPEHPDTTVPLALLIEFGFRNAA